MAKKSKMSVTSLKIQQIGTTGTEVYATWTALSSTNQKYTDKLSVSWSYQVKNKSGANVWLSGSSSTVSKGASRTTQSYNAPDDAYAVKVTVTPTLTKKGKKYRTASSASATFSFDANIPEQPDAPNVVLDGYKLTATATRKTTDRYTDGFKFFIYKEDSSGVVSKSPFIQSDIIDVSSVGTAQFVINSITPGFRYYVTCKAYNKTSGKYGTGSKESEPSSVTESIIPTQVVVTSIETISRSEIKLTWENTPGAATENGYEIEYATKEEYFNTDKAQKTTANETYAFIELDIGNVWYFRVRAKNNGGEYGPWSSAPYLSAAAAVKPNPPTTWSIKSSAMINDLVSLYWTHNSADGSKPTVSKLVYQINDGEEQIVLVDHSDLTPDDTDFTFHYDITLEQGTFSDGDILNWKVATQGVAEMGYSDYSIQREIKVYSPVIVGIEALDVVTEYPINIRISALPLSQTCVACYVSIIANNDYEGEDYMGNAKYIHAGDSVYSQIFTNIGNEIELSLEPTDIILVNTESYTIKVDAAMTSSLNGVEEKQFSVDLPELTFNVDAGIFVDQSTLTAGIIPSCTYLEDDPEHPPVYRQCDENDKYDEDEVYFIDDHGTLADPQPTKDEFTSNPSSFYVVEAILVDTVKMDVYRINFDGTFTELARGLDNTGSTMITDPHPSLDNAKYRIIGRDYATMSTFYNDIISEDINQPGMVLQWDGEYNDIFTNLDIDALTEDGVGSASGGTTLILPYNVKTSESASPDVSLLSYIGRQSPTSYYGTQLGQNGNFSADVDATDTTTLELLRRLQIWMGDVYVRERNGLGYWARVDVSFNRDYHSVVMPVTFNIQRVDSTKP